MQSSSQLFPVSLVRAELVGELLEDVYLLKPNNSPDRSVEIAVTRLGLASDSETDTSKVGTSKPPIILLHGFYQNRSLWYGDRGRCFAEYLVREGFDVWIPEMRGHGFSPRNKLYAYNTIEKYVLYDLPSVSRFIYEQTQQAAHWHGYGAGGLSILAAMARGFFEDKAVATLGLWGAQVSHRILSQSMPILNWLAMSSVRAQGFSSGLKQGLGPEDEPLGIMKESTRWKKWFRIWQADASTNYWRLIKDIDQPLLALASPYDPNNPLRDCRRLFEQVGAEKKQWLCLSKAEGFQENYAMPEALDEGRAGADIWPRISAWLMEQSAY